MQREAKDARLFLMEELVKRDFKKKYKRSALGVLWSVLSPVLTMLIMRLVFTEFFGRTIPHYTTYILAGNIVFSFFRDTTSEGMNAVAGNARILSKVVLPKTYFVWSKCVSFLINFVISLSVFFIFCIFDKIQFGWHFFSLVFPTICVFFFSVGIAMFLSALYVFLKDVRYLWNVATRLLMYMSAVFYKIDRYPENFQKLFLLNPVYVYITYFRMVTIDGTIPDLCMNALALFYSIIAIVIGYLFFKKKEDRFVFYF